MTYKTPTLRLYHNLKSVNKRQLTVLTKKKLKNIDKKHVHSVINIFFDILNEQMLEDRELAFKNFLQFKMVSMPAKRALNYYTGQMGMSKPYNKICVKIDKKFNKVMLKNLDLESVVNHEDKKS